MSLLESVRTKSNEFVHINLFFITKRLFDIFISTVLLFALSPFALVILIVLYKREGRPIIVKDICAGKHSRPFKMYTFRTKTIPSKVIRALPPHPFPSTWDAGVPDEFTYRQDKNTFYTASGLRLKKYGFHKYPQLFNVLKGDMSFIGPSAELYEIATYYNRRQQIRLKVKPGIIGHAQLNDAANTNHGQKIADDLFYTENCSYIMEVKLMYRAFMKLIEESSKAFLK